MTQSTARNYVLVHGAWTGGWVWRDVAPLLRAKGHTVTTPTLTGLGDRQHLLSPEINLDTHVEDVVANIEMEGLENVVLVGWSFAGMVVTDVLAKIPEKISSMVYLDAFLPHNGKALVDYVEPSFAGKIKELAANKQNIPPVIPLEVFGVEDSAVLEFVSPRMCVHPFGTMLQASKALPERPAHIPSTYIRCTGFSNPAFDEFLSQAQLDPNFETHIMSTSHVAMLTDPLGTADILANVPVGDS